MPARCRVHVWVLEDSRCDRFCVRKLSLGFVLRAFQRLCFVSVFSHPRCVWVRYLVVMSEDDDAEAGAVSFCPS